MNNTNKFGISFMSYPTEDLKEFLVEFLEDIEELIDLRMGDLTLHWANPRTKLSTKEIDTAIVFNLSKIKDICFLLSLRGEHLTVSTLTRRLSEALAFDELQREILDKKRKEV